MILLNFVGGLFFVSRIAAEAREHVLWKVTLLVTGLVALVGASGLVVFYMELAGRLDPRTFFIIRDIRGAVDLAALVVVVTALVRTARPKRDEHRDTPSVAPDAGPGLGYGTIGGKE